MKTSMAALALLLSSLSLALQLKTPKPIPIFDKFATSAKISEFDFRAMTANVEMIRGASVMYQGVGIPFIRQLTDDHQTIIVRALVSEKELPKDFEERKTALLMKAASSVGDVGGAFELNFDDKSALHAVRVEFVSISDLVKETSDPTRVKPYAEWQDGELTFH